MKNIILILLLVFSFLFFSNVEVNAQSCNGTLNCYINEPTHKCSVSGVDCTNAACPLLQDSCQSSPNYVPSGTISCSSGDCQFYKVTIKCTGSDGNLQSKECTWVGAPPPATCGNGVCNSNESCSTCPGDCGGCGGNGSCGSCDCGHGNQCYKGPSGNCIWDPGYCSNGGPPPPPPPAQGVCGSSCNSDSDCQSTSASGGQVFCYLGTHTCQNRSCPGTSEAGANCYCSGSRECGQLVGPTSQGTFPRNCKSGGSIYVNEGYCGPPENATTYCVGNANPAFTLGWCGPAGQSNQYLIGPGGKTTGITQAEINSTCSCLPADAVTGLSPANGSTYPGGAMGNVALTWNGIGGTGGFGSPDESAVSVSSYDVEVYPTGTSCSDPHAHCLYKTTLKYNIYTFPAEAYSYQFRIRSYNPNCDMAGVWSNWNTFKVGGFDTVDGDVYDSSQYPPTIDPATGLCTSSSFPANLGIVSNGLTGEYHNNLPYANAFAVALTSTPRLWRVPNLDYTEINHSNGTPGSQDGHWSVRWNATVRNSTNAPIPDNFNFHYDWGAQRGVRVLIDEATNGWSQTNWAGGIFPPGISHLKIDHTTDEAAVWRFGWEGIGVLDNQYDYVAPGAIQVIKGSTIANVTGSDGTTSYGPVNTDSDGHYTLHAPFYKNGIVKLNLPTGWKCTCPAGCTYSGQSAVTRNVNFFVTNEASSWWQVIGGDVITNGDVQSSIPAQCTLPTCNPKFILDSASGFPGNALYGTSAGFTSNSDVSSTGWLGKAIYQGRKYDYAYFDGLATSVTFNNLGAVATQSNLDSGSSVNGYYWYKSAGDLTLNSDIVISGDRKEIIFVPGNLNLNNKINIQNKGQGFFMVIVQGNININADLTAVSGAALEGLFIADGSINTGAGNTKLYVRGTLAGWGGVNLKRNLGASNSSSSAETVEYAPDLSLLFPHDLVQDRVGWREVLP